MKSLKRVAVWVAVATMVWVALSFLPRSWRLSGTMVPFGFVGTLLAVEKEEDGKKKRTRLELFSSRADYIGLALLILVIAAVWQGADLPALIRVLVRK